MRLKVLGLYLENHSPSGTACKCVCWRWEGGRQPEYSCEIILTSGLKGNIVLVQEPNAHSWLGVANFFIDYCMQVA